MHRPLPAWLLAAPASLLLAPADGPRFAPEPGTELHRELRLEHTRHTEEMVLTIQDSENDLSGIERTTVRELEFHDTLGAVEGGRPTRLHRRFETVSREQETDGTPESVEVNQHDRTSALEGRGVDFTWDPEAEAYARAWDEDSDGQPTWLDGLEPDLDLLAFLPGEDVEEGDSWDVAPRHLATLLRPGGDLWPEPQVPEEEDPGEGSIQIQVPNLDDLRLEPRFEGELRLTHAGTREVDGRELLVLRLDAELAFEGDVTDELNADRERSGREPLDLVESAVATELEAEGELLWDPEHHRAHGWTLEAEVEQEFALRWRMDVLGNEIELSLEGLEREAWRGTARVR